MTLYIPYSQWFIIEQWLMQNYYGIQDYSSIRIGDAIAITFANTLQYTEFYHRWNSIIWVDNDC